MLGLLRKAGQFALGINPQVYIIVFIAALQFTTACGWNQSHKALVKEKASHAADIQSYKTAQTQAEQKAKDETQRLMRISQEKANEADKNYSSLYAKYRANLVRYQANQSVPGRPDSGQSGEASQSSDGPGTSTNVFTGQIVITTADADICASNTARLQVGHDWALKLDDKAQ